MCAYEGGGCVHMRGVGGWVHAYGEGCVTAVHTIHTHN